MAEVTSEITENDRTTAIGLFNYANSYWRSAFALQKLDVQDITHPTAPVDFLYVHAIELFLKSYLRLNKSAIELKHIGHKFEDLKENCADLFFDQDVDLSQTIEMITDHKIIMHSRYIYTGARSGYPETQRFQRLCEFLYSAIKPKMRAAGFPVR